ASSAGKACSVTPAMSHSGDSRRRSGTGGALLAMLACLTVAACAGPSSPAGPGSSVALATPGQPATPKTLVIAVQSEPSGLNPYLTAGLELGGAAQADLIAHNYLVVNTDSGALRPQLAQSLISPSDGTWRLNGDGTMDTTWVLRSNEQWQDGAPFTAEDLRFTLAVYKDRAVPSKPGALGSSANVLSAMQSAETPDERTFLIHWSSIFANADQAPNLVPLPEHLLAETYEQDKQNFVNSPYLGGQFIGLGPYRLT